MEADNAEELGANSTARERLHELKSSLQLSRSDTLSSPLRPLLDSGEDVATWNDFIAAIPQVERNWLDGPWIVTEFYVHRRVVEAFQYFETGYDPYKVQKRNGLLECVEAVEQLSVVFLNQEALSSTSSDLIELGVFISLWGNKKDLSLFPAYDGLSGQPLPEESDAPAPTMTHTLTELRANSVEFVLDNQMDQLLSRLCVQPVNNPVAKRSVGIVVDNAGLEVISDFFLGHALLTSGVTDQVIFYTKEHPTFVSGTRLSSVVNQLCLTLSAWDDVLENRRNYRRLP